LVTPLLFTGHEITPGPLNAAELEQFFRDGLDTFWHQCCTAKMGRDAMSVVDGKLKVYGVDGLRIADAPIMPRVTTGNTMAPCVMIGEQAAALLCSEHKLKDSSLDAAIGTKETCYKNSDLTQEKFASTQILTLGEAFKQNESHQERH
jgi:choline dehydrogenase-like flavoprotein